MPIHATALPITTGESFTLPVTTSSTSGINTEKSTGFTREHRTPASPAAPVLFGEEKAVTSATTTLGWDDFKRRQSSKPSMPGML